MRKFALLLLLVSGFGFAQSLNDYKYVIVPKKFVFQKEPDKYNLNALTKALFEKYGFIVYYDTDVFPEEVGNFNCNKLYANVENEGVLLSTNLLLTLSDCRKTVLFSGKGKSREKDLNVAYNLALRDAAKAFNAVNYKYNGTTIGTEKAVVKTTTDGSSVKQEVITSNPAPTDVPGAARLFAQPIENGYQLVDQSPKVVFRIYNTSSKDVFMAEKDQTKGTLLNKNGTWIFEYYNNGKLVTETYNIKF